MNANAHPITSEIKKILVLILCDRDVIMIKTAETNNKTKLDKRKFTVYLPPPRYRLKPVIMLIQEP